ncbi:glycosyltransferase family 4 protein [Mucilaginibacter terrae]|uniref:Glycosyltransferase involved in cell wall biosynthesis n=1 Tax=Mucilaginibacter terrae TaxID=1955052 RepID=A0ABU3GQX8_9SPHI|nr:glycosyltransferase family 4 protein [Mucilaginibacter terrae]MDT3402183.1 glycosyltransferase involved in cell wall biosynthesis [Mucilaginibacter terrae]
MTVVYYTSTHFLDLSLDIINVLKRQVQLHVFIEVTSASKKSTVADIESFPEGKILASPAELLTEKSYAELAPYFEGTVSVHFVIHRHQTGFSWSTLQASKQVWNFIKPFEPQIVHFEGYTLRTVGLLPFLLSVKKVFLTVHDPVPHTGEGSWKISLPNFLFFNLSVKKYIILYSEFAAKLFATNYNKVKAQKVIVKMRPYSYYKKAKVTDEAVTKHLLFFGRLSPYKGVDVLLQAMQNVIQQFPNEKLVIAGKSTNGYKLPEDQISQLANNIEVINRYITNDELIELIAGAKFIICPYLDATQSGVLMTAYASNVPVIASNVGSFPEYIFHNITGLLTPPANHAELAKEIASALNKNHYQELEHNLTALNAQQSWEQSLAPVLKAYSS